MNSGCSSIVERWVQARVQRGWVRLNKGVAAVQDPSGYLWEVTPLMPPTTEPVREINLLVSDLAASTRFYCDLLGMRVVKEERGEDYQRVRAIRGLNELAIGADAVFAPVATFFGGLVLSDVVRVGKGQRRQQTKHTHHACASRCSSSREPLSSQQIM